MEINLDNLRRRIAQSFNEVAHTAADNWDNLGHKDKESWEDFRQHIAMLLLCHDPGAVNFSELDPDMLLQFPDND